MKVVPKSNCNTISEPHVCDQAKDNHRQSSGLKKCDLLAHNISSSVHERSLSITNRSKLLKKELKGFKSKARYGYQSLIVPRHEHFPPGTVFIRLEGDLLDMSLTNPAHLGSQSSLICVSVMKHNWLPLRTGIHLEQKAHHDVQLHFCRVSVK